MRRSILLVVAFLALAVYPAQARAAAYELERNPTLETIYIMYLLSPSARPPIVGLRPLAEQARQHFAPFASHPSVQLLDGMIREDRQNHSGTWISWLTTLTILGLSSPRPVPDASFDPHRIGLPEFEFSQGARWTQIMQAVNRFYREAHVAAYFEHVQPSYDCAFEEFRRHMPRATLLPAMERYYGTRLERYVFVPSPLFNPTLNMGVSVITRSGRQAFMVMGPTKVTHDIDAYGCGFDGAENLDWLAIHEFGHSFVNPIFETPGMGARINQFSYLYGPIRDEQTEQGMPDWFGTVIEHIVRLGEIRVLESLGDTQGAQSRRLEHILHRKFIYLPLLEERIAEYEAHRDRYPTFESFAERLIAAFSDGPPTGSATPH